MKQVIRAKFRCTQITHHDGGLQEVKLRAVQSPENAEWAKWTPSGELTMQISNPAAQTIVAGKEYFLDITEA